MPDIDQHLDEDELLGIIHRYDGVIAGDDEFTAAVFDAADRLDVLVKWGIGTDNIDMEAAKWKGVTVTNTSGAFAEEVADVVIGYAIMMTRKLHLIDREVRRGNWMSPRGVSLKGRTMGILGVGSIGTETARRAYVHGLDVVGHDVEPIDEGLKAENELDEVDLDELFDRSEIVSLHCPLTKATKGLVGLDELRKLGPDGCIINTARGGILDQQALIESLQQGLIRGASLDVFETEPLPATNPLTNMNNVILGSHNAQNTEEAVESVNRRAVSMLLDGLVE